MAKQVRKELDGDRRKRRRQAPDPKQAVVDTPAPQEETEAETQDVEAEAEAEAQDQQPDREQAQEQEQPSKAVAEEDGPVEQQQARDAPASVQATPPLSARTALRHVSKQLARPSNQVCTLVPLDRLLPVQPVDVREFADWQSLRAYVSSYAQQTNQLYFVQSVVSVATHNASIIRSGSVEPQVPELLGVYSHVFGCIHGTGPQHSDLQRWGNTQCPAEIKAHVVRDWHGHWRVVISQQFAFHNHYVHQELIERYAQTRVRAESVMTAATGPVGLPIGQPHSTAGINAPTLLSPPGAPYQPAPHSTIGINAPTLLSPPATPYTTMSQFRPAPTYIQQPPRHHSSSKYKMAMQQRQLEPTEIKQLDDMVAAVPETHQFVFVDWPEFRAYMAAYSKATFQHFQEAESESVSTRNAMLVKSTKDDAARLIPERFATYSVLLRCVHYHTDSQVDRPALDTKCPAQVIACLKRDEASGAWHVSIVQQVTTHNHTVSKSLYACYAHNSPYTPHQATAADADVIDLTEDQVTSEQAAHNEQTSVVYSLEASNSALQDPNAQTLTNGESRNEAYVEEGEEEDLGRCESNDEATEVEQLDHLIRVRPMRQRVFSDWNAVSDYLAAYTRATHQLYSVRTATPASTRNAKIMEQKYARPELLIPERFEHYVRTWQCVHSGTNRPRPQNTGKRPNQRYRTMNCPAQVNACVKRQGHSGVWEVVITNQNALHNHHINKTIFKSYVENRRITDPALLNGIMRLHFQGIKCKGVMEYIHKHSDIEPKPKDVHNLIRKLVQEGWTADRCTEEPEEVATQTHREESGVSGVADSTGNTQPTTSSNRIENMHANCDRQINGSANAKEQRPRIDSALLADIQKLATSGASGQQILEFINAQTAAGAGGEF